MNTSFKVGDRTFGGIVTAVPRALETHYFFELGDSPPFTIRLNDDGVWESDNSEIDPELVNSAGEQIESMEDLSLQ